jgi:hypothetical protein
MRPVRVVFFVVYVLTTGCFSIGGDDPCPGHATYGGCDLNRSECGCPLASDIDSRRIEGQACSAVGLACADDSYGYPTPTCTCTQIRPGVQLWICGELDMSMSIAADLRNGDLGIVDGGGRD